MSEKPAPQLVRKLQRVVRAAVEERAGVGERADEVLRATHPENACFEARGGKWGNVASVIQVSM